MASTGSTLHLIQNFSLTRVYSSHAHHRTSSSPPACIPPPQRTSINIINLPNRRQSLFMLTASTALTAVEISSAARAQEIPFFGIRKKLEKVEEEAVEILKEGSEAAEKGIEAAEKGIEAAEKEIINAEKEIESSSSSVMSLSFGGGVTQAGIVLGAEALGVLVATSVVSGILGPEGQN